MKIKTLGAKNWYSCQLDRIDASFRELGYDLVSDDFNDKVELIYANDPGGFAKAIEHKQQFGGKLILNILDRPWHCAEIKEWDVKVKEQLKQADAITTISKYTQSQVKQHLGFDSKVIYQPIKPVGFINNTTKNGLAMLVGRQLDGNKRAMLAVRATQDFCERNRLSFEDGYLSVFGSEDISYGNYYGVVSDEQLKLEYNQHLVTLICSKNEGINLPLVESLVCYTPVIVCNDMTTASEFAPQEMMVEPKVEKIADKIAEIQENYWRYFTIAATFGDEHKKKFDKLTIAGNILEVYNKL